MKRLHARIAPGRYFGAGLVLFALFATYFVFASDAFATVYERTEQKLAEAARALALAPTPWPSPLDKKAYDRRVLALAHIPFGSTTSDATVAASTTLKLRISSASSSVAVAGEPWPVAQPYPHGGAILPEKRIVAYYGNFYSTKMGVLGEYPEEVVLEKLASTTEAWAAADPATPTIPAIHYIAVVAQGSATGNGKWIARMPDDQVDKALDMAHRIGGLLFLDVQVGQSTVEHEIPMLEKYLAKPEVHLAIDPEFSMKRGEAPGTVIGTYTAADINWTIRYLARLVREHELPPKVLVVHRFTQDMVTGYRQITPQPEVQVVIDMDGWGSQAKKKNTYQRIQEAEPVQFTGLKLFYHADLKPPSTGLLTKQEVLSLYPTPIYIQYQ